MTKTDAGSGRQQETDKKTCFKKQNKQAANLTKKKRTSQENKLKYLMGSYNTGSCPYCASRVCLEKIPKS